MNLVKAASALSIPVDIAKDLRKEAMVLHSWYTREANGLDYNEEKGCWEEHWEIISAFGHQDGWVKVRDLESGAKRRIKAICERFGLKYYILTDPRGAALWVSSSVELNDLNYHVAGTPFYK